MNRKLLLKAAVRFLPVAICAMTFAILAVGIVGIIALGKSALLSGLLSYTTFTTVATYSMTTIPLYVLCAQLILEAGVVEDLFNILYNISKGRKGVLGTFCCILGAFLGAVCGSGTATSAALARLHLRLWGRQPIPSWSSGATAPIWRRQPLPLPDLWPVLFLPV